MRRHCRLSRALQRQESTGMHHADGPSAMVIGGPAMGAPLPHGMLLDLLEHVSTAGVPRRCIGVAMAKHDAAIC
jgi:hypothetical protein